MGWKVGTGLGKKGTGIVEPIKAVGTIGSAGIGVIQRDEEMHQVGVQCGV